MRSKHILLVTVLTAFAFATPSCNKYEDGPKFTLLTKKMRLTNDWDIVEYEDSDGDVVADNSSDYFSFEKDGTYRANYGNFSYKGEWEFADNKEKLAISYQEGSITVTEKREILRLTNKELWLKDSDGTIIRAEAK